MYSTAGRCSLLAHKLLEQPCSSKRVTRYSLHGSSLLPGERHQEGRLESCQRGNFTWEERRFGVGHEVQFARGRCYQAGSVRRDAQELPARQFHAGGGGWRGSQGTDLRGKL